MRDFPLLISYVIDVIGEKLYQIESVSVGVLFNIVDLEPDYSIREGC